MSEPAQKIAAWSLPSVDGPIVGRYRRIEDLQALEREAWEAGFAAGRAAGSAAAQQEQQSLTGELNARVQRLGSILDLMTRPLQALDDEVHRQLVAMTAAIARQLVRRELKTQPDQIVAVVRETVALLPGASRDVRVHLHPDDAALLRQRLTEPTQDRAWSIVEDPVLTRGGCRVTSEHSTIDMRLEQRLGALVAAVLGDERSPASGAAP